MTPTMARTTGDYREPQYFQNAKTHIESRVRAGRVLDIRLAAGTVLDVIGQLERHVSNFLPRRAGCARTVGGNVYLGALED